MDPLEEAIDVAVSSRKKLREYCSPSVRPRTLRCHLTKRPNPRRPQLSVPTRRSLDRLSSLKFRDCNRTRSTTPYKQTVSSYSLQQNIISGDLGDVFFFFFRIKLKGNYIIIVLFFEIFHTFSNSVPFSETNKSFANFFFIF